MCTERTKLKRNPWPESASKLHRTSDRRLSAKLMPTFTNSGVSTHRHTQRARGFPNAHLAMFPGIAKICFQIAISSNRLSRSSGVHFRFEVPLEGNNHRQRGQENVQAAEARCVVKQHAPETFLDGLPWMCQLYGESHHLARTIRRRAEFRDDSVLVQAVDENVMDFPLPNSEHSVC
jgi:hypothetical protein